MTIILFLIAVAILSILGALDINIWAAGFTVVFCGLFWMTVFCGV